MARGTLGDNFARTMSRKNLVDGSKLWKGSKDDPACLKGIDSGAVFK